MTAAQQPSHRHATHATARVAGAACVAIALLGSLTLPASLAAQGNPGGADRAATIAAIDSVVASYLKGGRAAGMSVAVVKGRDTLVMKGYGYADLELDVPTPDRAVYEIGSVTKQFTAAAILQLQEQGKLSLDDDITKHLPDYPTQGHRIPLRRLLDHTSGIRGYTEMPVFRVLMPQRLPRDTLVKLFSHEPFDFAPGEALVYNNSAYFLLGLIIEKVSGMSYAEYVQKNLFDRVGMRDSRYCSENAIVKRRANGYDTGPAGLVRAAYLDHTWPYAAGSLCSTVGDLVAWTQALHGGRVLSPASYREIITPGALNDGARVRYAKGLSPTPIAGHRAIHHGGGINGFLSQLAWFPDDSAVITVLVNTTGPVSPDAVTESLAEVVLGRPSRKTERFAGDATPYVGTYRGVGRGSDLSVTISAGDGGLMAQFGQGRAVPLAHVSGDTFEQGSRRLEFVREGGRVTKLRADMVSVYSVLVRQ
jgi:CubicO group peptidase (beta-lactamase class C family)